MAKSGGTRIVLGERDRERPERIRTGPHSIPGHVRRATIILHPGDGLTLTRTMRATGMSKPTVRRWWDRFPVDGGESGDRGPDGVRHPKGSWPQAPRGQDIQGLPRLEVRAEGPRGRRPPRRSARPRRGHPGGRESARERHWFG